ncbi:hypothetical protein B566_EDAN017015 [Ephemera danica]|nr:hypothetical protein B566_EDAN017015 [Ephemera danica]
MPEKQQQDTDVIEYSKLNSLNVKYNNDKSRDYTNPNLPTGDPSLDSALALTGATGVLASPFAAMHGLGNPLTSPYASSVGVCNPHHRETHPALLYNGGSSSWLQPQQHDRDHSSPQKSAGIFPYLVAAAMPLAGFSLPGGGGANALGGSATGLRLPVQAATGSVLLVSNLNEEMVTPDALFTLFGVYGDVLRVKILFNKKDSALVQMAEAHHAHLAMTHMDKLHVFGKQIRVMPSKHQSVQLPKEGQPDAGLTKDYTNSPLHRFKKPGSKNYQNIYPPSATLHLSNIPPQLTEEAIKEAFTNAGFTVKAFKFFPKDRKMALIQMQSIEDAVMALIKMHNYQLSESNHLRVSFSKSTI